MLIINNITIKTSVGLHKILKEYLKSNKNFNNIHISNYDDLLQILNLISYDTNHKIKEKRILNVLNYMFLKLENGFPRRQLIKHINDCGWKYFNLTRYKNYIKFREYNKSGSTSLIFYKLKYGLNWKNKWDNKISATDQIYNPEYIARRESLTIEEAKEYIEKYKKDKATSLQGFILRHGEEKGKEKFIEFQKTSAYSSSDEWFKNKFGENWVEEREKFYQMSSKRCTLYWTNLGYTLEEAKKLVTEHQKSTAGVHREYWEKLGLSENDINTKFIEIDAKKALTPRNRLFLKEIHGEKWREIYNEYTKKYRKNMEDKGIWLPEQIISEFEEYKKEVWFFTTMSIKENNIENIEYRGVEYSYDLDHKYSIRKGFENNIEPEIIGSFYNLEIISSTQNRSKKEKCSIELNELLNLYKSNNCFGKN